MVAIGTFLRQARSVVPRGVPLARDDWDQRHRWLMRLLWLHVPFVLVFAAVRGVDPVHALVEATPIALMGVAASRVTLRRRVRAMAAGLGLMLASAVLVHLSGGVTEVHFHFFVMVGVIALYQDWWPFLVSIGFVAVHHTLAGVLAPEGVFDKPEAWRNPLLWAGIHAVFVLAASAASVAAWGIVEAGHRRSREQLAASERRFRSLIEESCDVVTVVTPDGLVAYESPASERILGTRRDGRIGTRAMDVVLDDDRALVAETMACVSSPGAATELEFRVRHVDGSVRWVEASVTNLVHEEAIGGFVVNYRDVTERRCLEQQLAHQAFHDPLTGLANRALLHDRIEHALASARFDSGTQLAVLYLDLDDFKTVNDALGHDIGDEVLREAARRILGALRPGDTAARLGGDEFAVLLTDLPNHDTAYEVGARVLEALATPVDTSQEAVVINASIGIALSSAGEDASALLRNADLAMYRAKGEGKGRFEIYEAGMHAVALERIALKADMRRAIEAGEFEPHYQPIIDLPSGRIVGAEALVRWNHPDRGLVSPAAFVPIAEESGLIVTIGSQVLHRACRDAAGWARDLGAAAPATVSVNLSPRQILDSGIVADVEQALVTSGLAPSSLVLEITESILVDDTEAAARTLGRLKSLGVRIALDDFGTGYSSLTYLDRFPVDVLKIDKSFVDALGDGGAEHPLVAAIVHLGRTLGLQVTAEGVEGPGQLAQLRSMGCGLGQGYYFARPMPAEELRRGLEERAVAVARAIR